MYTYLPIYTSISIYMYNVNIQMTHILRMHISIYIYIHYTYTHYGPFWSMLDPTRPYRKLLKNYRRINQTSKDIQYQSRTLQHRLINDLSMGSQTLKGPRYHNLAFFISCTCWMAV